MKKSVEKNFRLGFTISSVELSSKAFILVYESDLETNPYQSDMSRVL